MSNDWMHGLLVGFSAAMMGIGAAAAGPVVIENDSQSNVIELYVFPTQGIDVFESADKSFAGENLVAGEPMKTGEIVETDVKTGDGACEFTVAARLDDGYQQENYVDFCTYGRYRIDLGVDYDSAASQEPAEVAAPAPCDIQAGMMELNPLLEERFPDPSVPEAQPFVEKFEKLMMAAMGNDGATACGMIAEIERALGAAAPTALAAGKTPRPMAAPEFSGRPEEYRGIWASPDCVAAESLSIYTAADTFYSSDGWVGLLPITSLETTGRLDRITIGWPVDQAITYFIERAEGDTLTEVYIPDDASMDALPEADWDRATYQMCDTVPAQFTLYYGEIVTWIEALPSLRAGCAEGAGNGCLEAVWRLGDVSGDGLLSLAELSRILRILTQAAAISHEDGAETEELGMATLGSVLVAPLAGNLILASLDYDDDGRLSPEELLQDRANLIELLRRPELRGGLDITVLMDELSNLEGLAQMLLQ